MTSESLRTETVPTAIQARQQSSNDGDRQSQHLLATSRHRWVPNLMSRRVSDTSHDFARSSRQCLVADLRRVSDATSLLPA